jgi:translation elongation factor EF-Tu-like GTPase
MVRIHTILDDFEAVIRIYSTSEGGRMTPPFNGIRWDFAYAENQPVGELYMIHPDFYDSRGDSLPTDQPLPIGVEMFARMVVIMDEMREKIHRARIREGIRFYCHEGGKRVAEGRVTRITGLFNERPERENAV